MSELSEKLKQARVLNGFTLRQVEEVTGVSNAYLSQLENGKIKKPSATVLYKLANLYNVTLDSLLHGIIKNSQGFSINDSAELKPYNITPDEGKQLLEYLAFLRYRKKSLLNI